MGLESQTVGLLGTEVDMQYGCTWKSSRQICCWHPKQIIVFSHHQKVCFLKMGTVEKGDVKLSFLVSVSPFISVLTLGAEISPDF